MCELCRPLLEKQGELLSRVRAPFWQCKIQAGCSLLVPAETAALVGQAVRGDSAEPSKASAPRALQEHTLLIYEQHILWAEGVWFQTCRRIKADPGVYMWAQVRLEIRGRLS